LTCPVCWLSLWGFVYSYLYVMSCVWQLQNNQKYDDDDDDDDDEVAFFLCGVHFHCSAHLVMLSSVLLDGCPSQFHFLLLNYSSTGFSPVLFHDSLLAIVIITKPLWTVASLHCCHGAYRHSSSYEVTFWCQYRSGNHKSFVVDEVSVAIWCWASNQWRGPSASTELAVPMSSQCTFIILHKHLIIKTGSRPTILSVLVQDSNVFSLIICLLCTDLFLVCIIYFKDCWRWRHGWCHWGNLVCDR